jgi:hypothetical protein
MTSSRVRREQNLEQVAAGADLAVSEMIRTDCSKALFQDTGQSGNRTMTGIVLRLSTHLQCSTKASRTLPSSGSYPLPVLPTCGSLLPLSRDRLMRKIMHSFDDADSIRICCYVVLLCVSFS